MIVPEEFLIRLKKRLYLIYHGHDALSGYADILIDESIKEIEFQLSKNYEREASKGKPSKKR